MDRYQELTDLLRDWKPPAELTISSPREVKLAGSGIVVACLAVAMVIGAIAAGIGLSRARGKSIEAARTLSQSGIRTQAVVTRHFRSGGESEERKITYEFQYDGRTYRATTKAPRSVWNNLSEGSPIEVRFAPGTPEMSHPVDWDIDVMPGWVPGAIAAALFGIALMLLHLIRRQMQLLSDGRPAPAIVIGHRRVKGGQVLKYEFPIVGGGVGKGRGGQTRKPPPVGATITVLYDRDNPKRSLPYPFDMVRVAR